MQSCTAMLDRKLRTPIFLGYLVPADMDAAVRTLVVISLFAALCAASAIVLDQGFFTAIFVAELAFALVEAIRRSR
jgi:hypothetical protein